jgi:O-antigen/teichoic acid export membrane protein
VPRESRHVSGSRFANPVAQVRRLANAIAPFFWNAISSMALQGGALVTAVLLVRLIEPRQFGAFSITQNTLATVGTLSTLGLALTGNRYVALMQVSAPLRGRALHQALLVVSCILGASAGLLTCVFAPVLSSSFLHDPSLSRGIFVSGLGVPFACIASVQTGMFAGYGAFRKLAVGSVLQSATSLAAAITGAALAGPVGAIAGLGTSFLLRSLFNLLVLPAPSGPPIDPAAARWLGGQILPFALPAALAGMTLFPAAWFANALLVRHVGTSSFAVFAVYLLIKTALTFLPLQTGTVLLSRLARESDVRQADAYVLKVTLLTAAVGGAGALLVATFPTEIFHLVAPRLQPDATTLRVYIATAVLEPLAILYSYRVAANGAMWRALTFYSLPKDALLTVLALWLVPRFGALGLAIAYTASWTLGVTSATTLAWSSRPAAVPSL